MEINLELSSCGRRVMPFIVLHFEPLIVSARLRMKNGLKSMTKVNSLQSGRLSVEQQDWSNWRLGKVCYMQICSSLDVIMLMYIMYFLLVMCVIFRRI